MRDLKSVLMMPAIYRFELPNDPKISKWGWHKTTELIEALRNILASQGSSMTLEELCAKYRHTFPTKVNERGYPISFLSIKNGRVWNSSVGSESNDWLKYFAEEDCFLPAKIGTALIDAAKHPVLGAIREV